MKEWFGQLRRALAAHYGPGRRSWARRLAARGLVDLCREAPYGRLPDQLARTPWGRLVLEAALGHLYQRLRAGEARYLPERATFVDAASGAPLARRLLEPKTNPNLAEYMELRPSLLRFLGPIDDPDRGCPEPLRRPTRRFYRYFPEELLGELHGPLHEREGRLSPDVRRGALEEPRALAAVYTCARLREGVAVDEAFLQRVERLALASPRLHLPALRYLLVPSCRDGA